MTQRERSIWPAIITGILGLSVGYAIVTLSEPTAFAGAYRCPLHEEAVCETCNANDCAEGRCGAECETCRGHKAA